MSVKQVCRVSGVKCFKDSIEGKAYDSTTLFVEMPLSTKGGNTKGCGSVEMKFGKSDEFAKMDGLQFPLNAELELELTVKGYEVLAFKAVSAANAKG